MGNDDELRLKTSEPLVPLGPSVYTRQTGQAPEAGAAVDVTAALAGPCVYAPAERDQSTKAGDPGTGHR
jgi:hypothetical protein